MVAAVVVVVVICQLSFQRCLDVLQFWPTCFHSLPSAPLKWSSFWVNHSSWVAPARLTRSPRNLLKALNRPSATHNKQLNSDSKSKTAPLLAKELIWKAMLTTEWETAARNHVIVFHLIMWHVLLRLYWRVKRRKFDNFHFSPGQWSRLSESHCKFAKLIEWLTVEHITIIYLNRITK